MYKDKEIAVRPIERADLPRLWELIYTEENPEWKQWDAPYLPHYTKSWEEFAEMQDGWIASDHRWVITVHEEICGKWFLTIMRMNRRTGWKWGLCCISQAAGTNPLEQEL